MQDIARDMTEIVAPDSPVEKVNDAPFVFLEGPVWDARRARLFFTDPLAQTVHALREDGTFATVMENSGYANGMCLCPNGNLAICKMDTGSLNELDPDTGRLVRVIADGYEGRPFQATNDVVCDAGGGYYVTDPIFRYGPRGQSVEATYYCAPDGRVQIAARDSLKPNGLAFSPDGGTLYIDDTGSAKVWAYTVGADGTLTDPRVFCELVLPENAANLPPVQRYGEADGMKVDSLGNVYVTTISGIQVFNALGGYLGIIRMPGEYSPANIAFGGGDLKTLYITARIWLYAVRVRIAGLA